MLDMRFGGVPRFLVYFRRPRDPDNSDGPPFADSVGARATVSTTPAGVNWTRHRRPPPPMRPRPKPHLHLVE